MNYTILVNKEFPLEENYIPSNLVITDNNENNFHKFVNPNLKPMINEKVFEQFKKLQKAAIKDKYNFIIDSGYRSYSYQQEIFNSIELEKGIKYAKKYVALPGYSEHQTGLAIDIAVIRNKIFCDELTIDEAEWLKNNAYKYGFILRYPEGKESITGYNYEPWHYRYVGEELSTIIYKNNLTLEEYYKKS